MPLSSMFFDDSLNNFSYSTRHLVLKVILVSLVTGDTNGGS